MKKIIIMFLIVTLLVTGCKSTAAKNTEIAINKIGVVSLDSKTLIDDAQSNYDALTDKQKDQVDNYKVLLDAKNEYIKLEDEKVAKESASEISNMIDVLANQLCRKQEDVDKLNSLYNDLKEEYRDLVSNSNQIEEINALSQYENYALAAVKEIKNSLKASDSFKLKEITLTTCKTGSLSPYYVSVRYSGTNSFGGEKDTSSFVDINEEGKSVWWSMSALLGGLEDNELLMYGDCLKHKDQEYVIDPERIIKNM